MKTRAYFSTLLFILLSAAMMGCSDSATQKASDASTAGQDSSNANSSSGNSSSSGAAPVEQAASATANQNQGASRAGKSPITLAGTYTISEVENQGVVSMVDTKKAATIITFKPSGTYRRESTKEGLPYHIDSGTFRIEEPDRLVLRILMVNLKSQSQPKEAQHTFKLSPDGEELKLISKDGKVATFRRSEAAN